MANSHRGACAATALTWTKQAAVALLLPVFLLAACGGAPEVPTDRFYRVEITQAPESGRRVLDGTLVAEPFAAEGVLTGRPIVFSRADTPGELEEYLYHFWAEAPAVMLRDLTVDYLRRAGAAEAVVMPEMRVDARYRLTGRIHRLEHRRGGTDQAIVKLEVGITDTRAARVVFLGSYERAAEARDGSVGAMVSAAEQALNAILARMLTDLRAAPIGS